MVASQPTELNEADFLEEKAPANVESRRRYPRKTARWRIEVQNTRKLIFKGSTLNVSQDGIQFSLQHGLATGEQIFITISAFAQGMAFEIKCIAKVCHCTISGSLFNIGVQFVRIDEKAVNFLANYTAVTEIG
ncbi:MAG: PilZ domain-containing protein [Hahellaceae bacterium]|nr:PilZ domain-containing protein [Hahellaceae bacterium]MCP5170580.1 PilZ domain-containing protein [Hahellaceae bacterium]